MKNKKDIDSIHPLVMAEEFWMDSHLSLARYYGQIRFGGNLYIIVNKDGKTLLECSIEADKQGRGKAIPAGEPADLCLAELVPVYKWLGRDEFLKRIKDGVKASELLAEYKEKNSKKKKFVKDAHQQTLIFDKNDET